MDTTKDLATVNFNALDQIAGLDDEEQPEAEDN